MINRLYSDDSDVYKMLACRRINKSPTEIRFYPSIFSVSLFLLYFSLVFIFISSNFIETSCNTTPVWTLTASIGLANAFLFTAVWHPGQSYLCLLMTSQFVTENHYFQQTFNFWTNFIFDVNALAGWKFGLGAGAVLVPSLLKGLIIIKLISP